MIGVRLELEGALAIGPRTLLLNILRCVEKAGLEIVDILFFNRWQLVKLLYLMMKSI